MNQMYMFRAIELAQLGTGATSPNPLVGAVIVSDVDGTSRIIGEGYHQRYGQAHAEVNAFVDMDARGESAIGATMYVTLEPCSHTGKQPPCVEEVIRRGVARVVIGMKDPNPLVAGRGIARLEESGVEVIVGVLEKQCMRLNEPFIKNITTGVPFVHMKTAMSLDGKIATHTGSSKWVTGEDARAYVQYLRKKYRAIMVGAGTVKADNPELTCRIPCERNPIRVVVDVDCSSPLDSKVFSPTESTPTVLVTSERAPEVPLETLRARGVDVIKGEVDGLGNIKMEAVLRELATMGIDGILLEGGGELNSLMLPYVDRVEMIVAPKLVGGRDAKTPIEGLGIANMTDALELQDVECRGLGQDILIGGTLSHKRQNL